MGAGNEFEVNTLSINIVIQKGILIDIEIPIYDIFTTLCSDWTLKHLPVLKTEFSDNPSQGRHLAEL